MLSDTEKNYNQVALQICSVAVIFYLRKTVLADGIFFIRCSPVICLIKANVGPHFRVKTCGWVFNFFFVVRFMVRLFRCRTKKWWAVRKWSAMTGDLGSARCSLLSYSALFIDVYNCVSLDQAVITRRYTQLYIHINSKGKCFLKFNVCCGQKKCSL